MNNVNFFYKYERHASKIVFEESESPGSLNIYGDRQNFDVPFDSIRFEFAARSHALFRER